MKAAKYGRLGLSACAARADRKPGSGGGAGGAARLMLQQCCCDGFTTVGCDLKAHDELLWTRHETLCVRSSQPK